MSPTPTAWHEAAARALARKKPKPGILCPKCGEPFRRKGACPTQWCERHDRWECGSHLLFLDQWTCEGFSADDEYRLAKANESCQ